MKLFYMLLFALLVFCIACENDMNEVERITSDHNPQLDMGEDVQILYSENGIVKARISAPELIKDNTGSPFVEFKKGIKVDILDKAQKVVTVMTANYGKRYDKAGETIVQDNVIVTNEQGDKLETEELTRNDKTGELNTDAYVKITTATEIIHGLGLKANEDFSWYRIDSIQGFVNTNNSDFL